MLFDPAASLFEAFKHHTPTMAQAATAERFEAEGFEVTWSYGDGALRMDRRLPNGDSLYTFIRADGSASKVRCWEAAIEEIQRQHEAAAC